MWKAVNQYSKEETEMAISPFDPLALSRWDPFSEMTSLRDAMSRLMESAFVSPTVGAGTADLLALPVDVWENENEYVVQATLPGKRPEDVKIAVQGNTLTIEGERKPREQREGERLIFGEHRYGRFARSFSFNAPVNADQAQARFENGVLHLTVPKTEAARPKQIRIAGGDGQKVIEGEQVKH
jgi:HSP20 family protein